MKRILVIVLVVILALSLMACGEAAPNQVSEPTGEPTNEPTTEPTPEPTPLPLLGGDTDAFSKALSKLDFEAALEIVNDYIDANPSADLATDKMVRDKLQQAKELAEGYEVEIDDFDETGSILLKAEGDGIAKYGFGQEGFYIVYFRIGYSVINLDEIKVKAGEETFEYPSLKDHVQTNEVDGTGMYSEFIWIKTYPETLDSMANADAISVRFIGDSQEDYEFAKADIEGIGDLYNLYVIFAELLEYTK